MSSLPSSFGRHSIRHLYGQHRVCVTRLARACATVELEARWPPYCKLSPLALCFSCPFTLHGITRLVAPGCLPHSVPSLTCNAGSDGDDSESQPQTCVGTTSGFPARTLFLRRGSTLTEGQLIQPGEPCKARILGLVSAISGLNHQRLRAAWPHRHQPYPIVATLRHPTELLPLLSCVPPNVCNAP